MRELYSLLTFTRNLFIHTQGRGADAVVPSLPLCVYFHQATCSWWSVGRRTAAAAAPGRCRPILFRFGWRWLIGKEPRRKKKRDGRKRRSGRPGRRTESLLYAGKYSTAAAAAAATVDITTSISRSGGALYFKAKKVKRKAEFIYKKRQSLKGGFGCHCQQFFKAGEKDPLGLMQVDCCLYLRLYK